MLLSETFKPEVLIRFFTIMSLGGLLFAVGLRLQLSEVISSLRSCRLTVLLVLNFVLVPLLAFGIVRLFSLPGEVAAGILLLSAAPFAPVVPVFVKLARGDLALAAGLTTLFPLFSTVLTPAVCHASLDALVQSSDLDVGFSRLFILLFSTISVPLLFGMLIRAMLPKLAGWLLKPLEIVSEAIGVLSLVFVTWFESSTIFATDWKSLLVMILISEATFIMGYVAGGPGVESRRVVAFGTANRNIALGILLAVGSFPGTEIVASVVTFGLLLIFLGLLHVAFFRLLSFNLKRSRFSR